MKPKRQNRARSVSDTMLDGAGGHVSCIWRLTALCVRFSSEAAAEILPWRAALSNASNPETDGKNRLFNICSPSRVWKYV